MTKFSLRIFFVANFIVSAQARFLRCAPQKLLKGARQAALFRQAEE